MSGVTSVEAIGAVAPDPHMRAQSVAPPTASSHLEAAVHEASAAPVVQAQLAAAPTISDRSLSQLIGLSSAQAQPQNPAVVDVQNLSGPQLSQMKPAEIGQVSILSLRVDQIASLSMAELRALIPATP